MDNSKGVPTPMVTNLKLTSQGSDKFDNASLYRSVVGSLQYATLTRPEISYSVNKVSQYTQKPLLSHWNCVKRIMRYLAGSIDQGLTFHPCSDLEIFAFSDSDWGSDIDDRRSTCGYCVYLGANLVSWSSRKQASVSRSSTESEYQGLAAADSQIIWIQNLLTELHVNTTITPTLYCDNISAVLLAANPILHGRTKHFELDLHFVRKRVNQKKLYVVHINSKDQVAGILTKPLSSSIFLHFRVNLKSYSSYNYEFEGE
ncbi:Copia protein [Arachis hypogaea]|nr:Copia protein [Arachis hypogaea]